MPKGTDISAAVDHAAQRLTGLSVLPRVLITDDEPITRMLVKLLLERENYEVLEASNGRQAVDIASREHPDLLIVDHGVFRRLTVTAA